MKKKIKELIVVEGRDDISAIKAAVDAEVVAVHGFSVNRYKNLDKLETAYKNVGLIVFTDPDYAGEQIRRAINKRYPNSKNAFISKKEGSKAGDLGVENATPESIIRALENAKMEEVTDKIEEIFTMEDLLDSGLIGQNNSKELRAALGERLSIGYCNGKQLLSKLNRYNITKDEFEKALK